MYEKIESYLRENFPGKRLIRYIKLKDKKAEIWGKYGIKILVVEKGQEVFYQPIFNTDVK